MKRFASAVGLALLGFSSSAEAMPNAFWIFGFHVPGKHGPKSDIAKASKDSARPTGQGGLAVTTAADAPPITRTSVEPVPPSM